MAENTETSGWSNPKLIIPLVLIAIGALVGIPIFLKYRATNAENKNTGDEAKADSALADKQAASLGIDKGRALAMINAARTIYNEVTKSYAYVSTDIIVGALNLCQSDTEMNALNTAYNGQVSNSSRTLKADVDRYVIGGVWPYVSSTAITYYNDIT